MGAVHNLGAFLGTAQVVGARHAADEVAVHVHGQADLGAQGAHKLGSTIRHQKAGHIFDAQRISAQLGELARVGNVVVERVDRAPRVRDRGFKMRADLFDGRRAITDVIYVVQGIEHTEDVDAIGMGTFNKPLNHIR